MIVGIDIWITMVQVSFNIVLEEDFKLEILGSGQILNNVKHFFPSIFFILICHSKKTSYSWCSFYSSVIIFGWVTAKTGLVLRVTIS